MYLTVNKGYTPANHSVYSLLRFTPYEISYQIVNEDGLKAIYNKCAVESESINIEINDSGEIITRSDHLGFLSPQKLSDKYKPVSFRIPLDSNYIWSILTSAIFEEATVITSTDEKGKLIDSIQYDDVNSIIRINNVSYSSLDGKFEKELRIKYPSSKLIVSIYSNHSGADGWCRLDSSNNTVTFLLNKLSYSSNLKGTIEFIAPPLKKLIDSTLQKYDDSIQGFLIAFNVVNSYTTLSPISADLRPLQEVLLQVTPKISDIISLMSKGVPTELFASHSRASVIAGADAYIKYGKHEELSKNPDNEYILQFMRQEYLMVKLYSYMLNEGGNHDYA